MLKINHCVALNYWIANGKYLYNSNCYVFFFVSFWERKKKKEEREGFVATFAACYCDILWLKMTKNTMSMYSKLILKLECFNHNNALIIFIHLFYYLFVYIFINYFCFNYFLCFYFAFFIFYFYFALICFNYVNVLLGFMNSWMLCEMIWDFHWSLLHENLQPCKKYFNFAF